LNPTFTDGGRPKDMMPSVMAAFQIWNFNGAPVHDIISDFKMTVYSGRGILDGSL